MDELDEDELERQVSMPFSPDSPSSSFDIGRHGTRANMEGLGRMVGASDESPSLGRQSSRQSQETPVRRSGDLGDEEDEYSPDSLRKAPKGSRGDFDEAGARDSHKGAARKGDRMQAEDSVFRDGTEEEMEDDVSGGVTGRKGGRTEEEEAARRERKAQRKARKAERMEAAARAGREGENEEVEGETDTVTTPSRRKGARTEEEEAAHRERKAQRRAKRAERMQQQCMSTREGEVGESEDIESMEASGVRQGRKGDRADEEALSGRAGGQEKARKGDRMHAEGVSRHGEEPLEEPEEMMSAPSARRGRKGNRAEEEALAGGRDQHRGKARKGDRMHGQAVSRTAAEEEE